MFGFSYLFLFGFLWTSVLAANCPYKECYCVGASIFCDYRYLNEIPQLLIKKNNFMDTLSMNGNNISTIPARRLPSNITELSMQDNPIETIDPAAFDDSLNTLETLSFSNARFTQLPEAMLHLNVLQNLNLYNINILVWNEDAMKRFGLTMETLNLDSVGLTKWPDWITSFTHLTELSITGCPFSSLPDDALDMVANTLTGLGLYNNSLTSVPKTISKLTVLRTLLLEQNKISDITWLPRFGTVTILSLNNNKISNASALSDAMSYHSELLYKLDIHDNLLTSIPNLPFFKYVTSLDYTNNMISDPNSGSVPPGLTDLKLSNNLLPFIPRILKTINPLPNIVLTHNSIIAIQATDFPISTIGVDLGHNFITELTNTSFPEGSAITQLLLNHNPLSTISPLALKNLANLQELDLQYSKLTRLPLAIASLTNLKEINLTGSIHLVCTCNEKSLGTLIQTLPPDNVLGNCGHISIYTFFTQRSPRCP